MSPSTRNGHKRPFSETGPEFAPSDSEPVSSLFARLEIINRGISAFLEHGVDPLDDQIVNLDPFMKSDLAQRFVHALGQVKARMDDVWPRPPASRLPGHA